MRPAYSRISSALRLLPCTRRPGRSAWLWFEAGGGSRRASGRNWPTHFARRLSAARRWEAGRTAYVQPNMLRAAFAVQRLPLWAECEAGIRGGWLFEAFGRSRPLSHLSITASFLGERRSGKGQMGVGGV